MIGVSKRCCPACSVLLRVLSASNTTTPFHILGSHRTVTPWTLPPNLPNIVIDNIARTLERELARVLMRLILEMTLEDQTRRRSSVSLSDVSADLHPFTQDDQPERVSILMNRLQVASKYGESQLPWAGTSWIRSGMSHWGFYFVSVCFRLIIQ